MFVQGNVVTNLKVVDDNFNSDDSPVNPIYVHNSKLQIDSTHSNSDGLLIINCVLIDSKRLHKRSEDLIVIFRLNSLKPVKFETPYLRTDHQLDQYSLRSYLKNETHCFEVMI